MKNVIKNQSPQRDVSAPAEFSKREIREVLARFAQSIRSFDPRALERCFRVDHDREGELVKADILQNCVIRRLQDDRARMPILFGGVDHEPPESSLRKWQGAWITLCNDGR